MNNIIKTGTGGVIDEELVKRIKLVNTLSISLVALIFFVGGVYYSMTLKLNIVIPASIEAILAISPIFLNHYKKYDTAARITFFTQCLAALYFGLMLGNVIELQAMVIFLFLITFLIFKDDKIRRLCIAAACVILAVLEISYYNNLVTLIPLSHSMALLFKSLSVIGVLVLIVVVGKPYVKSNDEIHKANHFKKMYVYQVTHEMRTPLNAIYAAAQLLKREVKLDKQLKKIAPLVEHLLTASDNARHIINNVLDMAQIESGKMELASIEAFEVAPFISRIVDVNRIIARSRHIKLKLSIADMPPVIMGDALKLNQIITNLLSNAIKYTSKSSTVTITITGKGDTWEMQFRNGGNVIPSKKLHTIFDPFVTDKNRYTEGTGLGLYIVRNKVQSMGGTIQVESNEVTGSCFTVTLPLTSATLADIMQPEEDNMLHEDLSNIHVLIAEDDELNAKLLTLFLKNIGCTVTATSNGAEVLEEVKKAVPDLIIMDYHMQEMDGIATLKVLKETEKWRNIPVIISTGDIFTESKQQLLAAGADAVIEKPVDQHKLIALMNQYINHYDGELQE